MSAKLASGVNDLVHGRLTGTPTSAVQLYARSCAAFFLAHTAAECAFTEMRKYKVELEEQKKKISNPVLGGVPDEQAAMHAVVCAVAERKINLLPSPTTLVEVGEKLSQTFTAASSLLGVCPPLFGAAFNATYGPMVKETADKALAKCELLGIGTKRKEPDHPADPRDGANKQLKTADGNAVAVPKK
jgi:hypothetical protein